MQSRIQELTERFYPSLESRDPPTRLIHELERMASPELKILDVGAGAGELNSYKLKGRVAEITGVDFDPRVVHNPLLDRGILLDGPGLPFADDSFDVVFCIYVAEHVERPADFLREIRRILKPGGRFLGVTPNRWHYVCLISRFTPQLFHQWINQKRGRDRGDTFPTFYRLNDQRSLEICARKSGLKLAHCVYLECRPNYLTFAWPLFILGILYERLVNWTDRLKCFRVNLIFELEKPT